MINNEKKAEYKKEHDQMFEKYLDTRFFSIWKDKDREKNKYKHIPYLELILFPHCNYKCTYCYVTNHGDQLYPDIDGEKPELILQNLQIILNWITENQFYIDSLQLFSAELFVQPQWEDVFDMITSHIETTYSFIKSIAVPTNMSFVMNENTVKKLYAIKEELSVYHVQLFLSASVDGKFCDTITRPGHDDTPEKNHYTDAFYDRVFTVIKDFGGCHPMISAQNIAAWKQNIDWYLDMLQKYEVDTNWLYRDINKNDLRYGTPFLLEVRNDDWDDEAIADYVKFLYYLCDALLQKVCNGDIELLAILLLRLDNSKYTTRMQNNPLMMNVSGRLTCAIQRMMTIRVRYMDIVPCHRTCYPQFQSGKFRIEDNKIVGYEANNLPVMIKIAEANPIYSLPVCSSCPYNIICIGQCLGSMYESTKDIFTPIKSVCKLLATRYQTIVDIYEKYHIIEAARAFNNREADESKKNINTRIIDSKEDILCYLKTLRAPAQ